MLPFRPVSDAQWESLARQFCRPLPVSRARRRRGGRPPLPDRTCFNAMLWHVTMDGTWRGLPKEYGSPRVVIPRLYDWERSKLLMRLWRVYLDSIPLHELRHIGALFRHRFNRSRPFWQGALEYIYRLEFSQRVELTLALAPYRRRLEMELSSEVYATGVEETSDEEIESWDD